MEINVRYLTENDLDVLRDDIVEMWSKHHLNNKTLISQDSLEDTDLKKYFKRSLKRDKGFALIATIDEKVVGIIRIEEVALEEFFNYKKAYKVDDLVVKKEFRNIGVATSLLEKVKEIAKDKGIEVLKARIYSFNQPAQRFFEYKGFDKVYSEYFHPID